MQCKPSSYLLILMGQKPFDRFFQRLSHMFASRRIRHFERPSTQGEKTLFCPYFSAEYNGFNADFIARYHLG